MFFKILQYGIFDSHKEHISLTKTQPRIVTHFEFDLILTATKNATSYINSANHILHPHLLITRKPGDISYSRLHYKCYCLHLDIPNTSAIYADLLTLPMYYTFFDCNTYQRIFVELFQNCVKSKQHESNYLSAAKVFELVHHMISDAKVNQLSGTNIQSSNKELILKTIEFMKKSFTQDISLKMLADMAGYSPNHFRTMFQQQTSISPQQYLETLRINHAKFLLLQGELSIADIAYSCGFSSQSYFTKTFKLHTSFTPLEFRKNNTISFNG